MKRLSTLSESSITYPVTNSSEDVRPCQKKIRMANIAANPIQSALQARASRNLTVWDRRWKTPRSRTNIARTKRLNRIQKSINHLPAFDWHRNLTEIRNESGKIAKGLKANTQVHRQNRQNKSDP